MSAYKMFIDNKFFGKGVKMFRKLCSKKEFEYDEWSCTSHPHNTYFQLLAETGIFGFLLVFTIFILCLVELAKIYNFLLINDFAYSDIYFNDEKPPSLLNSDPELEHCVELYSLTKGYSMAGWRVGFAIGNENAISALTKLKSYVDYGTFQPIQIASTVAINDLDDYPKEVSSIYSERRLLAREYLIKNGFEVQESNATMFVWAKLPKNYKNDSMKFSLDLLSKSNVAVSPGVGFGKFGEGYIRLALVENKQRIRQAMKNFTKISNSD